MNETSGKVVCGIHKHYTNNIVKGYVTEDTFKKIKAIDELEASSILTRSEAQAKKLKLMKKDLT